MSEEILPCVQPCPYQKSEEAFPPCGYGIAVGSEVGMHQCDETAEMLREKFKRETKATAARITSGESGANVYITKQNPPNYGDWRTWDRVAEIKEGKIIRRIKTG